jgi:hypothetical protein
MRNSRERERERERGDVSFRLSLPTVCRTGLMDGHVPSLGGRDRGCCPPLDELDICTSDYTCPFDDNDIGAIQKDDLVARYSRGASPSRGRTNEGAPPTTPPGPSQPNQDEMR